MPVNSSNSDEPPAENPILTAYESFVSSTPLVTRTILNVLVVSYLGSWIVEPNYGLACIPQFVVHYYEIYRLITSVVVNQTLFSVLFASLSFVRTGKILEESLGSASVAWLCLAVFTLLTNSIFLGIQLIGSYVTSDSSLLLTSSSGIWVVLFGLISMECCHAAQYQNTRKLILFDVPTIYYPLALLVLFSLFSGRFQLSYAISTALGYGLGKGKLESLKLRPIFAKALEESSFFLNTRLSQRGWISGPGASGMAAWSQLENNDSGGNQRVSNDFMFRVLKILFSVSHAGGLFLVTDVIVVQLAGIPTGRATT